MCRDTGDRGEVGLATLIYERFAREDGISAVVNWRRGMAGNWEGDNFSGV